MTFENSLGPELWEREFFRKKFASFSSTVIVYSKSSGELTFENFLIPHNNSSGDRSDIREFPHNI